MTDSKLRQLITISLINLKIKIKAFSHWYIFPFQINSGAIGNSETGYKPINSKVTNFGSYELIFTGDSTVIVIWQGSTKIYQKNKGITDDKGNTTGQDEFYTKEYNLETAQSWKAYLIEDISSVNFSQSKSNTIFNTISIGRTYTLISFDEQIKVNDYLQFFVVLNDNDSNIAGGSKINEQDRQLLYLSNVTNKYYPMSNKFYCQIITLSSVNDRASSSGLTIQSFIQYGGAGSGYAFPEFINKKLQFNKQLMHNIGVRYSHRQFYGFEALTSIAYLGRPIIQGESPIQIDNKEIYRQKVFASRRLFIGGNNEFSSTNIKNNGGLFAGLNDPITTNSHPETTYYNIMDCKPTGFLNYSDWQEFLSAKQFNLLTEKSFKGILSFNAETAKKSNGTDIGEAKFFWDSEWIINNLTGNYNIEMSSNFKYKDHKTNIVIGSSVVNYSKIPQKWMSTVLNFNSVVFSSLLQMPYDSNQWIPFSLSKIPLIGKMLNALLLGIPVGFIINQNSEQYKKMLYFNSFQSAFFTNTLDKIFGKPGLIPLNVYSTQNSNEIGQLLGSKVSTTALLMKLTDRINIYPWDPKTGKRLTNKEQISTVDLSQEKDNKIYIMDEETEFLDIKSPLTTKDTNLQWNPTDDGISPGKNYAYIIDYIYTQSVSQGEERHTFYSDNPYTYQGDYNEISVAQYKIKNRASFTDNLFNWTTQYKLNHDEYSETEETTFSYPASILPPDPIDIAQPIEIELNLINNLEEIYKNLIVIVGRTVRDNTKEWFDNNDISINSKSINLKDYLNPKFLILTFNDLKRFYKSISIYYEYEVNTIEEKNNNNYSTSEIFVPSKSKIGYLEIDLNEIIETSISWIPNKIWEVTNVRGDEETVISSTNFEFLTFGYSLLNEMKFNINYRFVSYPNIELKIKNPITLSIKQNSLNFEFSIANILAKSESLIYFYGNNTNYHAYKFINLIKSKLTKIIFNPR